MKIFNKYTFGKICGLISTTWTDLYWGEEKDSVGRKTIKWAKIFKNNNAYDRWEFRGKVPLHPL